MQSRRKKSAVVIANIFRPDPRIYECSHAHSRGGTAMSVEQSPGRAGRLDASLTIAEFCQAEKISRSMLYRAWSEGWGPKFYRVGVTRRITYRARLEWQREREAEASSIGNGGLEK
jgi:hypothetical protein